MKEASRNEFQLASFVMDRVGVWLCLLMKVCRAYWAISPVISMVIVPPRAMSACVI